MALVWLLIFLKDAIAQTITGTVTLSSSGSSTEYDLEFDLSIDLSYGILLYSLAIIFTMLLTDMVVKCNKRNRHDGGGYSIQYQVGQDDNYGGTGGVVVVVVVVQQDHKFQHILKLVGILLIVVVVLRHYDFVLQFVFQCILNVVKDGNHFVWHH